MKAIITVTGRDTKGIIAAVSGACAEYGVNIIDISQSVLREYFAMIMMVDMSGLTISFSEFVDLMTKMGRERGLEIHTMHEEIFNSMHRI